MLTTKVRQTLATSRYQEEFPSRWSSLKRCTHVLMHTIIPAKLDWCHIRVKQWNSSNHQLPHCFQRLQGCNVCTRPLFDRWELHAQNLLLMDAGNNFPISEFLLPHSILFKCFWCSQISRFCEILVPEKSKFLGSRSHVSIFSLISVCLTYSSKIAFHFNVLHILNFRLNALLPCKHWEPRSSFTCV